MKTTNIIVFLAIFSFGCNRDSIGPTPIPAPKTAAFKLADVNSLATSFGKGLRLMIVVSEDVKTDGTSDMWRFEYADTFMPPTAYWFHATSTTVAFDSSRALGVGTAIISHPWFNSDSALSIAERNGGSQFRSANPHTTITASLGEPVVLNTTTYWWVTYRSADNSSTLLSLSIDANSGSMTRKP